MADSGKIIQRITRAQTSDIIHSSGFASMQNNGGFGTASTESFATRRSIDQNRKIVQGYRNSQLARGVNNMPRAKTFTQQQEARKNILGGSVMGATDTRLDTKPNTSQKGIMHYADSMKPNFKMKY